MSITNLIHKIKGKIDMDRVTIIYLFIIIGVGISSFCLGRLSTTNNLNTNDNITIKENENILKNQNIENNKTEVIGLVKPIEKKYVASKNGKMYYSIGCSGAKRIKPENEIWFGSIDDAEKSGFSLSSTCK